MKQSKPSPEQLKAMVKEYHAQRNAALKDRHKRAHAALLQRKMELAKKKAIKEQQALMKEITTERNPGSTRGHGKSTMSAIAAFGQAINLELGEKFSDLDLTAPGPRKTSNEILPYNPPSDFNPPTSGWKETEDTIEHNPPR